MKTGDKTKNKIVKTKKKDGVVKKKPKKEKVLVVAQEIKYARLLSGNEKKTRDRVLKALKKWLAACFEKRYDFKEEDFSRIWKGLFYAVWMSDKPLIQEELCDNIASILDEFPPDQLEYALLMTKAGFKTLATEWYGIDQHRIDKFLMLVRRYLRGSLRCLKRCDWSLDSCRKYALMLSGTDGLFAVQTPHYARNATSMLLHIIDCYLEEISKVSVGDIPGQSLAELLRPFILQIGGGQLYVKSRQLITQLLRQTDEYMQYEEKRRAWERMGCPEGGPDALEPASDDEETPQGQESDEEINHDPPLDPRAGSVHVWLSPLPVPVEDLTRMLTHTLTHATSKAHKRLKLCIQRLERVSRGECPLPLAPSALPAPPHTLPPTPRPTRVARNLHALENKLKSDADELKLRGLSRKHRKRLLRKSRAGISIVEEIQNKQLTKGEWTVDIIDEVTDKSANKENQKQNKKRKNNDKKQQNNKKRKLDNKSDNVTSDSVTSDSAATDNGVSDKIDSKTDTDKKVIGKGVKNINVKDKNKKGLVKDGVRKDGIMKKNKDKAKNIQKKDIAKDIVNNLQKKDNAKDIVNNLQKKDNAKEIVNNLLKKDNAKDIVNNLQKKVNVKEIVNNVQKKDTTLKENDKNTPKKDIPKSQDADKKDNTLKLQNKDAKPNKITKTNPKSDGPKFTANKIKKLQKGDTKKEFTKLYETPKKVKFVLKNNSMQKPVDYYRSVRDSPSIPFDSSKRPNKTNLKPSTPSPINPFFKKKLRIKQ